MTTTIEKLLEMLASEENEHLEFKEAKYRYDFDELVEYCVAIANERGGRLILGVSDKRPRCIVGSEAFPDIERTKATLTSRLSLRIDTDILNIDGKRVVVFNIPSRPLGQPKCTDKGKYLMRAGGSLVPMPPDQLKKIFAEELNDFSAQVCPHAIASHLDLPSIEDFRVRWYRQSKNSSIRNMPIHELLTASELMTENNLTYASIVLFGTEYAIGHLLPQSEVIFEYRKQESAGKAQERVSYRKGLFCYYDELWRMINARNDTQHFRDGLFVRDIKTFNEAVIREGILNAVAHRDYQRQDSIFVRQYAERIEIESPGGFPDGVTLENILSRVIPRNRRIADVLSKCGLVEKSGQGINLMFEESIKESKLLPDFNGTDDTRVFLTLNGKIKDPKFVKFIEQVGEETLRSFSTEDFVILDLINNNKPIPETLHRRLDVLLGLSVIERVGRGRGTTYILSRRFHDFIDRKGVYTRKRGLDRGTNLQLLLKHIRENKKTGSQLSELVQVLPTLTIDQVRELVKELKETGLVHCIGRTKAGRWYPLEKKSD
jgi:ATP-dependent DNA helicase RecG